MGECRSDDLRDRVLEAVAAGSSRRAAAERFSVSVSSAIRWSARAASEGNAKPRKQGRPAGKGPLAEHLDYLITAVGPHSQASERRQLGRIPDAPARCPECPLSRLAFLIGD